MKKVNSKKKWFLAAAVAMCLGILIAIPLYANINSNNTIWSFMTFSQDVEFPYYLRHPDYCHKYFKAELFYDQNGYLVLSFTMQECPRGLYFCYERQTCSWKWDPECCFAHCNC